MICFDINARKMQAFVNVIQHLCHKHGEGNASAFPFLFSVIVLLGINNFVVLVETA